MQPPSGQGGILAGTWKSVNLVQTQVWFTLKIVKSSGWIAFASLLYAIANAQPLRSLIPFVWKAAIGDFGHGLLRSFGSRMSPPSEDAKKEVAPLLQAISAVAGLPAGSSKMSAGLGGWSRWL